MHVFLVMHVSFRFVSYPLLAVLTHKYNQKQVMSKCTNCLMVYDLKENYTDQI